MWASITDGESTLTQLWFKASCWYMLRKPIIVYAAGQHLNGIGVLYSMCTHSRPHEVLTRAEWILASTDDAGPTYNRHWVSVCLYPPPPVIIFQINMLLNTVLTSHFVFRTSAWFQNGIINSTLYRILGKLG